ncbi:MULTISPECIES: hypothetical protein [unclassified Pseudomonas]|uniref:hypothetical protein n=1 Tax=unclassified Pseudomonas TaxID=196821 RepID=UPI000A1FF26D|nr:MULTISPECIES: hypothetical protein [unclassified Pseudomonas]
MQRPNQSKIVEYLLAPATTDPLLPEPTGADLCHRPSFWFRLKMSGFALGLAVLVGLATYGAWWGFSHDHESLVILGILVLYFVLDTV